MSTTEVRPLSKAPNPRALHSWLPTAPLGWVKCREHISLLIILCIILYVMNKAHLSLICICLFVGASLLSTWGCPTCSIGFWSGDIQCLATPSPSPSAARQLSSRQCVWGGYVGKQFLKGGDHALLQNVTVHVGIHVSLNERSSPVPAALMQPQTMMLTPPCLTVGKAQFSWYSSPGRRHTCWTPSKSNKFTLDSSDRRTWFQ